MENLKVTVKIYEILEKEGISLREMARRTDITHANLINLGKGKRERIQFSTITKIAETFNITDIRDIIDFTYEESAD